MLKIDNTLLDEIGLGALPEAEKNSFLKHVYETLEMRVGIRLADQMTNEQLDEFEQYFEAKDDAGAFKWLESNFPNYKEIVQQEFDKLKAEVAQSAPQILSASQAQAAAGPAANVPEGQVVPPAPAPAPQPAPPQPAAPAPVQQQPVAPPPAPDFAAAAAPAPQPANEFPQNPQPQPLQQPPAPDPAYQQPPAPQPAPPQYDAPAQQPPAGPTAPQPIQPPQPVQRQPHQPWQPDQQ